MSASEFVDWMAFAQIEPLPSQRADLHIAMVLYMLISMTKRKGSKKTKLESLIPDFWKDRKDPRRLAAKFRALTAHLDQEPEQEQEEEPTRITRRMA